MTTKTMNDLWAIYAPARVADTKTWKETTRIFSHYVAPALGAKRVDKIDFSMVEKLHQTMRGTPYQANRVLSLLRPMFKYAGALRWIQPGFNPAKDVPMFAERKRRRHLRKSEAPRIAQALREQEISAPSSALFFWLLIFTGARPNEILSATWGDIDENTIVLNEHKSVGKTGVDRLIHLPPAAWEKIEALTSEEYRSVPTNRIIKTRKPRVQWYVIKEKAKCIDLRLYDLRHTFATYALEKGFSLDQIGEALAHSDPKTTKIYAELTDNSRKRIATDTSLAILEDMGVI